eukprot:Skav217595  [mRNA]  locus=scaffold3512:158975:170464:- [translate_table: standard]
MARRAVAAVAVVAAVATAWHSALPAARPRRAGVAAPAVLSAISGKELPLTVGSAGGFEVKETGGKTGQVTTALDCGYRVIDTAQRYGNEEGIGRALSVAFAEGRVKRDEDGLVKQIGVSNYNERHLTELLDYAETRPMASQFEIHPFNTREKLVKMCPWASLAVCQSCTSQLQDCPADGAPMSFCLERSTDGAVSFTGTAVFPEAAGLLVYSKPLPGHLGHPLACPALLLWTATLRRAAKLRRVRAAVGPSFESFCDEVLGTWKGWASEKVGDAKDAKDGEETTAFTECNTKVTPIMRNCAACAGVVQGTNDWMRLDRDQKGFVFFDCGSWSAEDPGDNLLITSALQIGEQRQLVICKVATEPRLEEVQIVVQQLSQRGQSFRPPQPSQRIKFVEWPRQLDLSSMEIHGIQGISGSKAFISTRLSWKKLTNEDVKGMKGEGKVLDLPWDTEESDRSEGYELPGGFLAMKSLGPSGFWIIAMLQQGLASKIIARKYAIQSGTPTVVSVVMLSLSVSRLEIRLPATCAARGALCQGTGGHRRAPEGTGGHHGELGAVSVRLSLHGDVPIPGLRTASVPEHVVLGSGLELLDPDTSKEKPLICDKAGGCWTTRGVLH